MLRSILMGILAGQRSMVPLAMLAGAARRGILPHDNAPARLIARPSIAAGGVALAAAEMAGDKMEDAPDRTVFLGLLARTITSGFAGAALASRERQFTGAALGIGAAIVSSYAGLALRKRAMRRYGRVATGFIEDAIMLAAALPIVASPSHRGRTSRGA